MAESMRDQSGPDRDAQMHRAVAAEITDGPRVHMADNRLTCVNDLHGADLRAAGDRSRWKGGAQDVAVRHVIVDSARDGGGEMEYVPVGVEPFVVRDRDGTVQRHAAEVIPDQIDDHGK